MADPIVPKLTAAQNNTRATQNWEDGQMQRIVMTSFRDPDI